MLQQKHHLHHQLKKLFLDMVTTGSNVSITNLVSSSGVVATDTTGVGTARRLFSSSRIWW
jgi:hypothetical protein